MLKKHYGFSLIEILIAIILLGALASIIMFSAGGSTAAAKTNTIIQNMNIVKNAVLSYYNSNMFSGSLGISDFVTNYSKEYLGTFAVNKTDGNAYIVMEQAGATYKVEETTDKSWYVRCDFSDDNVDRTEIKNRLKNMAKSAQLLKKDRKGVYDGNGNNEYFVDIKIR